MCGSESAVCGIPRGARGFATPDALAGVALGLLALLVALGAVRGTALLGRGASLAAERGLALRWAADRIARELAHAGHGVCPGRESACPDEAVEALTAGAIVARGDLDGHDPARARDPERDLAGFSAAVPTGNDEVYGYLLRPGGTARAPALLLDADLDSADRVLLPDGTLLARRDGVVESVDCGPAVNGTMVAPGTLYRVTFTHEATDFGTSRFRVLEPLADGVRLFRVDAFDGQGTALPACGGTDDAAGRACRAAVRRVRVTLEAQGDDGRATRVVREIGLAGGGVP